MHNFKQKFNVIKHHMCKAQCILHLNRGKLRSSQSLPGQLHLKIIIFKCQKKCVAKTKCKCAEDCVCKMYSCSVTNPRHKAPKIWHTAFK